MLRRLTMILTLLLLAGGLVTAGPYFGESSAQEATPDTSPDADDCNWEQTTIAALQAIYGTPAPEGAGEAVSATQQADPVSVELPAGTAADESTIAEIETALLGFFACNNAGNYLAALSNVSEEMIRTAVGNSVYDEDLIASLEAAPVELAEELQTEIVSFRNHLVLDDGRVGALVDYINHADLSEGINGLETDFMILIKVGEEWHLHQVLENLEHQHGPEMMATPAA